MNGIFRFILALLVLTSHSVWADNKGLFWRFEKGPQVGYLLGSVHFADSSFYPLSTAIMTAYQQAEVLVVEVDDQSLPETEQQALLQRYGTYPDNKTLHDNLTPAALALINNLLAEFNIPLDSLKHYRPGMVAITIAVLQAEKLGYRADQGIDHYFLQKARYQKKIRQIEDFESQMKLLANLPEDDKLLQASFEDMRDYRDMWQAMMAAWKRGDGAGLYEEAIGAPLREAPELAPYFDALFFNRHPRMIQSAEDCVTDKEICFIVLGAGHMVGDAGIVKELQRRGYQVTQY